MLIKNYNHPNCVLSPPCKIIIVIKHLPRPLIAASLITSNNPDSLQAGCNLPSHTALHLVVKMLKMLKMLQAGCNLPSHTASHLVFRMLKTPEQSVTNIFEYSNIRIFLIRIYIRVFIRIIFWIRIYSDIHSWQDFDSNIFGYWFVSIFRTQKYSEDFFVDDLWILYFAYG